MTTTTDLNRRDALALVAGATTGPLVAGAGAHANEKNVPTKFDYHVVIVGGGPPGLTAALVLGRACRKVLVCDEGKPLNHASPAVHGFFSRDGVSPADLLETGRRPRPVRRGGRLPRGAAGRHRRRGRVAGGGHGEQGPAQG